MHVPADIKEYLSLHSKELGERILCSFLPHQGPKDEISPLLERMLRRPYPAQALAIMRHQQAMANCPRCSCRVKVRLGQEPCRIGRHAGRQRRAAVFGSGDVTAAVGEVDMGGLPNSFRHGKNLDD